MLTKCFEVNYLLEFLMDATNIQLDYSIYIGILLGLSLRLLLIWKLDTLFVSTFQTRTEWNIQVKNLSLQMKKQLNSCPVILWMIKSIRKKEGPGDEPDHYISPNFM